MPDQDLNVEYARVAELTARLSGLCDEVQRAHALGYGPGSQDEPWSIRTQRVAAPIYFDSTSASYQFDLARKFAGIARSMSRLSCPNSVEDEWHVVCSYLNAAADAINEFHATVEPSHELPRVAVDLAKPTPSVLRFDRLAGIYSAEGISELMHAADAVCAACTDGPATETVLTEDEQKWILRLIAGETEVEVAESSHISLRTFHRRLSALRTRLGARSLNETIAMCVRNGWVD